MEQDIIQSSPGILETQERANIDMLIATAKRWPREIGKIEERMLAEACRNQETAESCNYHLERDGHSIEGPSVRMAEIAVRHYQNIRFGARVLGHDGQTVAGQAFIHDLENNIFASWDTRRRITDKRGRTYSDDMIVTTGNAAAAIAFRTAVFKVIPSELINTVAEKAKQMAVGDTRTLSQRRTRALKKFAALGVTEARVLEFLERDSAEAITLNDVEKLFGAYTAIRDGTSSVEEVFGLVKSAVTAPNIKRKEAAKAPATTPLPPDKNAPQPILERSEPQESDLIAKIRAKLVQDNVSDERFFEIMTDYAMTKPSMQSWSEIEPKHLEAALLDWERSVLGREMV
jgi:hypothetical protein